MIQPDLELFQELDLKALQKKILGSLLKIQNVQRGSIWIEKQGLYLCVEAAGTEAAKIKGVSINIQQPSIVG